MGGPVTTELRVKEKPMDDVLSHFLGKGTVLKGPIPGYPSFPPWTVSKDFASVSVPGLTYPPASDEWHRRRPNGRA